MPKFRNKLVVVEAEQFFSKKKPWPKGVRRHSVVTKEEDDGAGGMFFLCTRRGQWRIFEADWIVTDETGHCGVCGPGVFPRSFEPVTDEDLAERFRAAILGARERLLAQNALRPGIREVVHWMMKRAGLENPK